VYLLIGPSSISEANPHGNSQLYVGQADSVADRLENHLKGETKKWWRTVVVVRRPEKSPLDLSQCKFLESSFCRLAKDAHKCMLMNKNAPRAAFLAEKKKRDTEDFLAKTVVILSALGLDFFKSDPVSSLKSRLPTEGVKPGTEVAKAPAVPDNFQELFQEIKATVGSSLFPKAEWYWTRTPDYRAKVVSNGSFRVFLRMVLTPKSVRINLKDVGKFKVASLLQLDEHRKEFLTAYQKAEAYLQRGT
jgi:predicted GIY-YIG superfamily endonuclease